MLYSMFQLITSTLAYQKCHRDVIENKKYPPKNKYYTPVFLHSDTFALEN